MKNLVKDDVETLGKLSEVCDEAVKLKNDEALLNDLHRDIKAVINKYDGRFKSKVSMEIFKKLRGFFYIK